MTRPDRAKVERLKNNGQLTFFQLSKCKRAECEADVPPTKTYCSQECWKKVEGEDAEPEE